MAADDFMDQTGPEDDCILSPIDLADQKKEEGNALYKTKSYIDALSKYSEAIVLCPKNPAFYGNRSACHMMLGQYSNALEDAKRSVSINPEFIKGYIRVAKCCMMLGDIMSAKQAIQQVATLDPNNTSLLSEKQSLERLENFKSSANEAFCLGDYRKAVYLLNQCKSIATGANDIKLSLAECLANLGRLSEAKEIAYALLRANSMDADAIYVKGLCLYYEDDIEKAFSHFQRVLMLAPDHHKAKEVFKRAKLLKQKKEDGNKAFKSSKLSNAYTLYTEALQIDPLNSLANAKLFFNRATVVAKLGKLEQSIEDCNSALELDESYLKALMRRAKSYMDLQDYENAVKDYETLARRDRHNSEYQQMLHNAKLEYKRSQRKDYYKILGVTKDANDDEIKKAYRKRALVHHPDRHSNASENERVEHEKIFKEVGEAYGILSDRKKRSKYDNGGDFEEVDPTQVFQTFFGTGGMSANFNGMPGGFHFQFG
uniref:DnaJlike proteinlike [Tribolium castaneum] n=1 Tax=Lepeophtheirus salmonis TaxID=72036 RepID=A0A0K2SZJ9_LEPSM